MAPVETKAIRREIRRTTQKLSALLKAEAKLRALLKKASKLQKKQIELQLKKLKDFYDDIKDVKPY